MESLVRKALIILFFYSFLFSQQTLLRQSTLSSSAVNATGEGVRLMGTLGQTFTGTTVSDDIILSTGIWGSIASVLLGIDDLLPTEFAISNAYPNPFNPTVSIDFSIPERTDVNIRIYDLLGRVIFVHEQEFMNPGKFRFQWHGVTNSGINIASGIYFVTIQHKAKIYNQKITYLK
tara:strand:+ start:178 stop:705 length:528 start_codon:yes stop_codon:yes gene_type:complete